MSSRYEIVIVKICSRRELGDVHFMQLTGKWTVSYIPSYIVSYERVFMYACKIYRLFVLSAKSFMYLVSALMLETVVWLF